MAAPPLTPHWKALRNNFHKNPHRVSQGSQGQLVIFASTARLVSAVVRENVSLSTVGKAEPPRLLLAPLPAVPPEPPASPALLPHATTPTTTTQMRRFVLNASTTPYQPTED